MSDESLASAPVTESGPDLTAIADRLFGKTSVPSTQNAPAVEPRAAEVPTAASEANTQQSTVTNAPDDVSLPDAIRELRDDPVRRMFSPQGTYASVPLEEAFEAVEIDAAVKMAAAREYREIFADIGASPQDAKELVQAVQMFSQEPMTPERDAANANDAIQMLNEQFGTDAAQALRDAQALVKRDPRLSQMLDRSRLGNDGKTIVKLVHLARSQKMRG